MNGVSLARRTHPQEGVLIITFSSRFHFSRSDQRNERWGWMGKQLNVSSLLKFG